MIYSIASTVETEQYHIISEWDLVSICLKDSQTGQEWVRRGKEPSSWGLNHQFSYQFTEVLITETRDEPLSWRFRHPTSVSNRWSIFIRLPLHLLYQFHLIWRLEIPSGIQVSGGRQHPRTLQKVRRVSFSHFTVSLFCRKMLHPLLLLLLLCVCHWPLMRWVRPMLSLRSPRLSWGVLRTLVSRLVLENQQKEKK